LISSFPREVDDNCIHLGLYASSSGNFLATFWDSGSVPSSWVRITYRSNLQGLKWLLRMERIGCPETSLRIYHYSMRKAPEERSSQYRHQL
jgi:hypothetical protein